MIKESPRRLFAFFESSWGVAIICALMAVGVMGGIIRAGNQPGVVTPPAGTVESENDSVTEEILTDDNDEITTETNEPELEYPTTHPRVTVRGESNTVYFPTEYDGYMLWTDIWYEGAWVSGEGSGAEGQILDICDELKHLNISEGETVTYFLMVREIP